MRVLVCVAVATGLLFGLVAVDRAFACTCASGSAFGAYAASDEIFTGSILSVTQDPSSEYVREIVRVRVGDSIKGSAAGEVEVISALCGFSFERGREYLIYAKYTEEGLTVYLCSRTRLLDLAGVDLAYIDGVREGRSGANVFGRAEREGVNGPFIRNQIPIRMVLSGTGGRFETVLDEGKIEFNFVPPGSYTLSAIGADVVKIMSSRSSGVALSRVTIDQSTDTSSLYVLLRIKESDIPIQTEPNTDNSALASPSIR